MWLLRLVTLASARARAARDRPEGPAGLWRRALHGLTYSKSWRVASHWRHKLAEVWKIPPPPLCGVLLRPRARVRALHGRGRRLQLLMQDVVIWQGLSSHVWWRMSSFWDQLSDCEAGSWLITSTSWRKDPWSTGWCLQQNRKGIKGE